MREHPASHPLREQSPEALVEMLVADLRAGEQEWLKDERDLIVALAPFHDCARRLGLDVSATFRRAAEAGPARLRDAVIAFGARDDVTADAFGYEVVDGVFGPTYLFR